MKRKMIMIRPPIGWISQAKASRILDCSVTEIRRRRQSGEIDFMELPNGRVQCLFADVQQLKNKPTRSPSDFSINEDGRIEDLTKENEKLRSMLDAANHLIGEAATEAKLLSEGNAGFKKLAKL